MPVRPFRYHVYHRRSFDRLPDWADARISLPRLSGRGTQMKRMYSLKKDMDKLRQIGAAKGIVDPGLVSLGSSAGRRELWALKVGHGAAHKVLFTGCHHAREWISVEVPYLVAEYLIENYTDTPSTEKEKRIKHLLMNRQIWFVPLVNPDGHHHTMTVDRLWRPNRKRHHVRAGHVTRGARTIRWSTKFYRGVDINRNYATSDWGTETFLGGSAVRTSRNPNDGGRNSIWCGPGPSSEAETALLDGLITSNTFRASITYHSMGQLILCPTGTSGDAYLQWVGHGLETLVNSFGNPYTYGESAVILYRTSGSASAFSYEKSPRPTYTPELRPDHAAPASFSFSGLPESEIGPTFREHLGAALALINCAGHDREAAENRLALTTASPPARCQMVRHCWEVFRGWTPSP